MRRKLTLLTLIFTLAVGTTAWAQPAAAQNAKSSAQSNVVQNVQVDERQDGTYITISGTAKPTYSVFKLQGPLRLFVDLSNTELKAGVSRTPRSVDNGVVSQVALLDFADEVQQVTRVIVGFDKHARYDVRTEGNSVVIFVSGEGRVKQGGPVASSGGVSESAQELALAKRALTEKERRLSEVENKVASLQSALAAAKGADRKALSQNLETERRHAASLRGELAQRERELGGIQARLRELENAYGTLKSEKAKLEERLSAERGRVESLKAEKESYVAKAASLKSERDRAKKRASQLAKDRDAAKRETARLDERAKKSRDALGDLERRLAKAERSLKDAERAKSRAQGRTERLQTEVASLKSSLGQSDLRAEKAKREVERIQGRLSSAKSSNAADSALVAQLQKELAGSKRALKQANRELERASADLRQKEGSLNEQVAKARGLERDRDAAERRAKDALAARTRQESKTKQVEDDRLKALAKAQRKESERLAALEVSRRKEQERLHSLAQARKAEEAELAKVKAARKSELAARDVEQRELASLRSTRKREAAEWERERKSIEAERQRLINERRQIEREEGKLASARRAKTKNNDRRELASQEAELKRRKQRLDRAEQELRELEQRGRATRAENAAEAKRLADLQLQLKRSEKARLAEQDKLVALRKELQQEEASKSQKLAQLQRKVQEEEARLAEVTQRREDEAKSLQAVADANGANRVRTIRFQQDEVVSRVVIELDRPSNFSTVPWHAGKAKLLLTDVQLPSQLERTLDTQAFGGTVRFVNSFQDDKGKVHVEAEVPTATTEIVRQDGSKLIWEFSSAGTLADSAVPPAPNRLPAPSGFTSAPPKYSPSVSRESDTPAWQRRPRGMARKRINLDLRGADIQNVLRLFAREGGVNIITGGGVNGNVTMRLVNVPISDAFVTVLKSLNLGYEQDYEVIRVAPASVFEAEAKRRREERLASFKLDPLEVVLVPINYAQAGAVQALVQPMLSNRGSVTVDARTNTLIIKDVAQNIAAAQQLILSLDNQTPQVLIEARIVETTDRYAQQLGIQWGGDFLFAAANGNPTGLSFPSVVGVQGAATDGQTPTAGLVGTPQFAVNLPAPVGTGSGGGIGFSFGSAGNGANLALRLTALEEQGHLKIISSPKAMTLDNESTTISQGTQIPISVVSAAGVQTQFVAANLSLQATPHVTQDGNIMLDLNINKSEADFANTGARGDPSIITKQATTKLLVGDGDTTVIAGIYTQSTGNNIAKVPFLADIPVLGWFFRDFSESESRTELLIFVTPRIVNREAALTSRRLSPIESPSVDSAPKQ